MSPFDRAHAISYSTLMETMRLSCTVFELGPIASYLSEVDYSNLPHLRVTSPLEITPVEFRRDLLVSEN